ncbi:MAG: hypothetical protein AAF670_02050 [Planctomycetota bacterium]
MSIANSAMPDARRSERRRTRFQLTPLLDLLLIIVFAQFLDVRQTSQDQAMTLARQSEKLTDRYARLSAELEGQRQALRQEQSSLRAARDAARADRDLALATAQMEAARLREATEQIQAALKLDDETVASFGIAGGETSAQDIDSAVDAALRLSQADSATLLRFMVSHGELLKRADVWNVHASDRGEIRLMAGDQTQRIRLESVSQRERTDEVVERLFAAYKQLEQPDGLVVVLVSFSPRSVAGVYQPLVDAVPETLRRLRADLPETRFEYSVLGTTPDPVNLSTRGPSTAPSD